jgi:hypothetical protein
MSNPIHPRKPAFASLRPCPPKFVPVDPNEFSLLLACVGSGKLLGRIGADAGPAGYYLHQSREGGTNFLKVVPAVHAARQRAADQVAVWVGRHGVRTPAPLRGFPRALDHDYAVFAYPYIASRFANATQAELNSIGKSLAVMHTALARFPDGAAVRRNSATRTAMLVKRRDLVCAGAHSPGPQPDLLREILSSESDIFSLLEVVPASQPVHGDLAYGNVLFPLEGSGPVLLDFEDSLISWLPVDMDIALALERFALVPEQDDDKALALGREMLRAYGKGSGRDTGFLVRPLCDSLRFLSVRALTTLAEFEAGSGLVATSEWDKFFGLYRDAVARRPLLAMLQDGFLA